jgi:hypothetical protein
MLISDPYFSPSGIHGSKRTESRLRIRIGSGFNYVSGYGSGFGISTCRYSAKILDPDPIIRIRSTGIDKELKYFKTQKLLLSSQKYDPGSLSLIPDPVFFRSESGSRIQGRGKKGALDPDPQYWCIIMRSVQFAWNGAGYTQYGTVPVDTGIQYTVP